jgi:hypothetical protein
MGKLSRVKSRALLIEKAYTWPNESIILCSTWANQDVASLVSTLKYPLANLDIFGQRALRRGFEPEVERKKKKCLLVSKEKPILSRRFFVLVYVLCGERKKMCRTFLVRLREPFAKEVQPTCLLR